MTAVATLTAIQSTSATPGSHEQFAVGPQYETTHVHVTPGTEQALVTSWTSTFGCTTPVPSPFGTERTGWLVTDLDQPVGVVRRGL